ncbi:MAG: response regulator transcription factor [Opitutales bacterium]
MPPTPAQTRPCQIFVVEDHARLRSLLETFFSMQEDIVCCGAASSAEEALPLIEAQQPDIVVADLSLPEMSGIDLIRQLRTARPGLRCIILSGHNESRYATQAIEAGAVGYILKGNPKEIADAVRRCHQGETVLSEGLD